MTKIWTDEKLVWHYSEPLPEPPYAGAAIIRTFDGKWKMLHVITAFVGQRAKKSKHYAAGWIGLWAEEDEGPASQDDLENLDAWCILWAEGP